MFFLDAGTDRVSIGTASSSATLYVYQSKADGAVSALRLRQDDQDYVLAEFAGYANVGGVDYTLVADSDFGTPGALVGWIQVEITDYGDRITDGDYYIPFYAAPSA